MSSVHLLTCILWFVMTNVHLVTCIPKVFCDQCASLDMCSMCFMANVHLLTYILYYQRSSAALGFVALYVECATVDMHILVCLMKCASVGIGLRNDR